MAAPIDPTSYLRFPKLDVAGALGLAKILLHRVPKGPTPAVRKAAFVLEKAVAELETKWTQQVVPLTRTDLRPLTRRLAGAWSSMRDRLITYESLPEGTADRQRAIAIHDLLFHDGLEFLKLTFIRQHVESERRIRIIDERGLAKDIGRLVGDYFLASLRASHHACGDALGITKATPIAAVAVVVVEPLRVLTEAISQYALQLLALAVFDPEKQEAVAIALSPIDDFRASVGRRVVTDDDDDDDEDEDVDDDVVTLAPAPTSPVVALAPVA